MKKKAKRNSHGCGLCSPFKRVGNSLGRYPAKERLMRKTKGEIRVEISEYEDMVAYKQLRKIFGCDEDET